MSDPRPTANSPVRSRWCPLLLSVPLAAAPVGAACAQGELPALPDSGAWGVHVLAAARDPGGALWLGTYGKGIYRLSSGAASWDVIRSDTTPGALSWDFVQAFGFGPRGQIWHGTVGNGWGLSVIGGNFQQHQGVEFNNPDGTPVLAAGAGTVVLAGGAEAGALTVSIRHDTTVARNGTTYRLYSTYYHNSSLGVTEGERVRAGQEIAQVGNTGRATNDHLHFELSASPTDSLGAIVDSSQRFPPYTTNAELWVEPLPGTGIVAGQVFGADGAPVRQARVVFRP